MEDGGAKNDGDYFAYSMNLVKQKKLPLDECQTYDGLKSVAGE